MDTKNVQSIEENSFQVGSYWKGQTERHVKHKFQSAVDTLVNNSKGMMGDAIWHGVDRSDSRYLTLACKGDRGKSAEDQTRCSFRVHCIVRRSCSLEIMKCNTFHCKDKCIFLKEDSQQYNTNDVTQQSQQKSIVLNNNANTCLVPPAMHTSASSTTISTIIHELPENETSEAKMADDTLNEASNSLVVETVESQNKIVLRKRCLRVLMSGNANTMSNFSIVKGKGIAKSFQTTYYNNNETRINIRSVQRYVRIAIDYTWIYEK